MAWISLDLFLHVVALKVGLFFFLSFPSLSPLSVLKHDDLKECSVRGAGLVLSLTLSCSLTRSRSLGRSAFFLVCSSWGSVRLFCVNKD